MANNRMAILMDTSLCVACYACRVACQNHNGLSAEQTYLSFRFQEKGTFPNVESHLARRSCMHCVEAPCASICPVSAIYTNEQGFVNVDEACIGCTVCLMVCPYDAPEIRDGMMHKCTGCSDIISDGQEPACVDTCIANAMTYGPVDELIAKANGRLEQIKEKYPDANVYGIEEQGGLGLLLVLRTTPDNFGLTTE